MARGTQLGTLVTMLKAECRQSSSVALGIDKTDTYKRLLRRHQETLYLAADWPHLRQFFTKALSAGSRYYDVPSGLNLERIESARVKFNSYPHPIERGIGEDQYASLDPDNDERADPVRRWDLRWTGSASQIEVWPLPASNDQTLRFKGIRNLRALTSDDDVADLDDNMIVLYAAAEVLAPTKAEDAKAKLSAGIALFNTLKGRVKGASPMTTYGGSVSQPAGRYGTIIRVA